MSKTGKHSDTNSTEAFFDVFLVKVLVVSS